MNHNKSDYELDFMELKIKILGIEYGGKPIVFLNINDADELCVSASRRLSILSNLY